MNTIFFILATILICAGLFGAIRALVERYAPSPKGASAGAGSEEESAPIITPPPKKEVAAPWAAPTPVPFDVKAYVAQEVAALAASYPRYYATRNCEKCHACAPDNPPRDTYSRAYLIPPHEIERENFKAAFDWEMGRRSIYDFYYPSKYAADSHHASGPGHIDRTCSRCGFAWTELAVDEREPV